MATGSSKLINRLAAVEAVMVPPSLSHPSELNLLRQEMIDLKLHMEHLHQTSTTGLGIDNFNDRLMVIEERAT